ncbi:MAG TPA: response regulator [Polyangia bacterium]|nr:response regulator [Polyangia bacterium]
MAFTILLVEDDIDVRDALAETLREEGYCVDCAKDGLDALSYLRRGGQPGLILLDLMMPRMSGSEFRTVQRKDPLLAQFPVVLLSADGRMREKAAALETAGAIRKPIDLDELLRVIEHFRGSSPHTAPLA